MGEFAIVTGEEGRPGDHAASRFPAAEDSRPTPNAFSRYNLFLDKFQIKRYRDAVQANTEMLKERLRSVGMRITAPRLAVLAAIHGGGHLNADAIAVVARERLGSLSQQAVYDNLHALSEAGLVRRIEPAHAPALYEARVGDNHHHLVCRRCGRIEDVDCVVGRRPCLEPSVTQGFLIVEAEVIFWGVCPACQSGGPEC